MNDNTHDTTNITNFYQMIATNTDLQASIRTHFGKDADSVLLHMTSGAKLDDDRAEEVIDFILEFLDDNAVLIASYRGIGEISQTEQDVRQNEFKEFHPEAAVLMDEQMQKLQNLGLSQNCNMVSGQLEPFDIKVLKFADLFIVEATDFESNFFETEQEAKVFAEGNYESWIANYSEIANRNVTNRY